jgi:Ion transport protein
VAYFLVGLLLLDVMILFVELFLSAEFPECRILERDAISCCEAVANNYGGNDDHARFLSEEAEHNFCELGSPGDYPAGCDPHKYPGVHTAHLTMRWITILILVTFLVELVVIIIACGPRTFFSNFFYCLDLFVVMVSLGLEIAFLLINTAQLELLLGLLLLARLWRFVRIGHGIFEATYELSSREQHKRAEYTKALEELCLANNLELPPSTERE